MTEIGHICAALVDCVLQQVVPHPWRGSQCLHFREMTVLFQKSLISGRYFLTFQEGFLFFGLRHGCNFSFFLRGSAWRVMDTFLKKYSAHSLQWQVHRKSMHSFLEEGLCFLTSMQLREPLVCPNLNELCHCFNDVLWCVPSNYPALFPSVSPHRLHRFSARVPAQLPW